MSFCTQLIEVESRGFDNMDGQIISLTGKNKQDDSIFSLAQNFDSVPYQHSFWYGFGTHECSEEKKVNLVKIEENMLCKKRLFY